MGRAGPVSGPIGPVCLPECLAFFAHDPAFLLVPIAFLDGLALIMHLLTLAQRDFQLGDPPPIKKQPQRHNRIALPAHRTQQLVDFAFV